jgi:hypothetical protein
VREVWPAERSEDCELPDVAWRSLIWRPFIWRSFIGRSFTPPEEVLGFPDDSERLLPALPPEWLADEPNLFQPLWSVRE